jgi:hypothetical protein
VTAINPSQRTLTLSAAPKNDAGIDPKLHPYLRRWEGDVQKIKIAKGNEAWVHLADGVQVQFSLRRPPYGGYRTGDYWLIPARTATGDVIWPRDDKEMPLAVPPHGVDHHYAPLAAWPQSERKDGNYANSFRNLVELSKT